MKCELRFEDGSVNLDMTTKLLRVVYKETRRIGTDTAIDSAHSVMTDNYKRWYAMDSYIVSEGTKPTRPQPPGYLGIQTGNDLAIFSGVDGITYWDTLQGFFGDTTNALFYQRFPTDAWPNSLATKYKDLFRVYDSTGNLIWSTGTLGDAVIRSTRITIDTFRKKYSYTSTTGRKLHILLGDSYKSGTYTEDESGNMWSASGLQMQWSNGGKTITFGYDSFNDNDIVNFFNNGGKVTLTLFEMFDD